ncbi:MAG: hypothetical protein GY899_16350 [Verrucomicrobiaceae bacterium]|nr:hypothetical protein [Verrucomicrobiaceae bacterium]
MNSPENIPATDTPFSSPFEEQQPNPSQTMEAAERLKQAAGNNVKRLQRAAEAGFKSFHSAADDGDSGLDAENDGENATWEELQTKFKEFHRESEEWARKNPTAALLTAAGAGFILGLLLKS